MAEPKRYFWLKLHKDFFKRKEIKRLRKIAGGDTYTIIYMEMLLRSIIDEGKLFFDGLEDDFASELALDLDEDEENVKITIQYLLKTGLLEIRSDEEYYLPDTKDSTGCETAVAVRVRRHREKQKALQCNANVTQVKHFCNGEIEIEKEIEKEIELEKEVEEEEKTTTTTAPIFSQEFINLYQSFEQEIGRPLSAIQQQELGYMLDDFNADLIYEALKEAVNQGKVNFAYIKAILTRWKQDNLLTVDLVRNSKANRNKKAEEDTQTNNFPPLPF